MKKRIDTSGDQHTYAELTPLTSPSHKGWWRFKLTTVYDTAKDPEYERVRLDLCLDSDALKSLREIFNSDEVNNG